MTSSVASQIRDITIGLLAQETERDQQRLVGASNLSNPCTRCLAEDMNGMLDPAQEVAPRGKYYLGAVIGTAIHALLEERASDAELLPEHRVVIGEIPGYGVLKSTSDLYVRDLKASVDYKTTTKQKLTTYQTAARLEPSDLEPETTVKARLTLKQYLVQLNLYGKGMEDAGFDVDTVNVVFICRDAKTEEDVWAYSQPYDRSIAQAALDRAARIWQALVEGKEVETFKSHPLCYRCSVLRKEIV